MSIRQVQTRKFLDAIIKSYLASGKKPSDTEVFAALNYFFSQQPAGTPIRIDPSFFRGEPKSDANILNDFMAAVQVNLEILFEEMDNQVDQNILLTTAFLAQLRSVKTKRKRLESRVDDFLLSLYNTDGYFYSVSDDFYDGDLTDFTYTDAFLDVDAGIVMLPTNADNSRIINLNGIDSPVVRVAERRDLSKPVPFVEEAPFDYAVDGLSNTAWYLMIRKVEPSDGVTVEVTVDFNLPQTTSEITQVTMVPHGVQPIQTAIEKVMVVDDQTTNRLPFSNTVKTSAEKMIFVNENPGQRISKLVFTMTKAQPDYYEDNIDRTRSGIYIIGLKDLIIAEQSYDPQATFVSTPLVIDQFLSNEQVIDAVSLTVESTIPANSRIDYYVAPDDPDATSLSDFNWQLIQPLSPDGNNGPDTLVNMNGAAQEVRYIRREVRDADDIELIPVNTFTNDVELKNPNNSVSTEFETYRIADFEEDFVPNTLTLEEGINTTKIYHTTLTDQNIDNTFAYWKLRFDNNDYESTYGEVDIGNEFFYGADVGENGRSVYVETNLYVDQDIPVVLREIKKSNPNSKLWTVKGFLNGREIADMPVGIDQLTAPLKFTRGQNKIIFAINIPNASLVSLVPYIGSIAFDLSEFGTIKLGDLVYVDKHKFQDAGYRDVGDISPNKWFTIYNKELVTRSLTTNNYRLRFAKPTGDAPDAVRLRADLLRFADNDRKSPLLDSYRVRFAYANKDES